MIRNLQIRKNYSSWDVLLRTFRSSCTRHTLRPEDLNLVDSYVIVVIPNSIFFNACIFHILRILVVTNFEIMSYRVMSRSQNFRGGVLPVIINIRLKSKQLIIRPNLLISVFSTHTLSVRATWIITNCFEYWNWRTLTSIWEHVFPDRTSFSCFLDTRWWMSFFHEHHDILERYPTSSLFDKSRVVSVEKIPLSIILFLVIFRRHGLHQLISNVAYLSISYRSRLQL